jgi:uncharacterized membrane protein
VIASSASRPLAVQEIDMRGGGIGIIGVIVIVLVILWLVGVIKL